MFMTIYTPFSVIAQAFLDECKEVGLSETYQNKIQTSLNYHINPYIGTLQISTITEAHIRKIEGHMKTVSKSDAYRANILSIVKAILNYANSHHLINQNPCDNIKATYARHLPSRIFSDEECISLLSAFDYLYLKNFYRFGYFSGLPFREIAALRLSDYDESSGKIRIENTLSFDHRQPRVIKHTKMPRTITLPQEAIDCISDELLLRASRIILQEAEDNIFTTPKGKLISYENIKYCSHLVQCKSCVTDFKVLYLRDNFLFRCIQEGMDDRSIENYFGIKDKSFLLRIHGQWEPITNPAALLNN